MGKVYLKCIYYSTKTVTNFLGICNRYSFHTRKKNNQKTNHNIFLWIFWNSHPLQWNIKCTFQGRVYFQHHWTTLTLGTQLSCTLVLWGAWLCPKNCEIFTGKGKAAPACSVLSSLTGAGNLQSLTQNWTGFPRGRTNWKDASLHVVVRLDYCSPSLGKQLPFNLFCRSNGQLLW